MTHVLDASAVMAVMLNEPGAEQISTEGRLYHLSAVTLGEIYTKVIERGGDPADVDIVINALPIRIRRFDEVQAREVGLLRPLTMSLGRSFGDRASLALARLIRLPVLTADKKWAELDIGVDIRLIR